MNFYLETEIFTNDGKWKRQKVKQNNNSPRASHFLVHFFAGTARLLETTTTVTLMQLFYGSRYE